MLHAFTHEEQSKIKDAMYARMEAGEPFTGWNVAKDTGRFEGKQNSWISSAIREFFNRGFMLGWASMKTDPENNLSPVIYFKPRKDDKVHRAAKEILAEIRG